VTLPAEIKILNTRLNGDYRLLQQHWHMHPLSSCRYKKLLFIGTGAILVWFSRYPSVRRVLFLTSLVTKSPMT
jgi:hypothetical protein